ncbi:MAG: Mov34/MPN/PAD-1 family protein [Candidatus Promineifilaceae bacterium]|nr:Mov34/MPN/PAD-1 family protein [Candidatus Promineifilaceae bacterium]
MTSASSSSNEPRAGAVKPAASKEDPSHARRSTTPKKPEERRDHQEQPPELKRLPRREPPQEDYLLHGHRPAEGQVVVILHQRAVREITAHTTSDQEREVGGALMGRAYRHEDQTFVDVHAALPAVTSDHGPFHFTFNADAWSRLHQDRAVLCPELDIVGWFHTHPDLGVFYSADDVVVHSAAFIMPWHIGLVVDPRRSEAAIFGWVPHDAHDRELTPLSGFYERLEEAQESRLPWTPVRAEVWADTPEEAFATGAAGVDNGSYLRGGRQIEAAPALLPALAQLSPWLGLFAGMTGVLLALFLFVFAVLPLQQRTRALEEVVGGMVAASLAGAVEQGEALCPDRRLQLLSPLPGERLVDDEVTIVGTAAHPEAARYRLELRLAGEGSWTPLHMFRRSRTVAPLAEWNTFSYPAGDYQLRLVALDGEGQALPDGSSCLIHFALASP